MSTRPPRQRPVCRLLLHLGQRSTDPGSEFVLIGFGPAGEDVTHASAHVLECVHAEHALGGDDAEVLGDGRPSIPGVVVTIISIPPCRCLRASGVPRPARCSACRPPATGAGPRPEHLDPARSRPAWSGRQATMLRRVYLSVSLYSEEDPPVVGKSCLLAGQWKPWLGGEDQNAVDPGRRAAAAAARRRPRQPVPAAGGGP